MITILGSSNSGPIVESDPTVPDWVKSITLSDISNWNGKVGEAPSDGKKYVRKDASWVEDTGGTPTTNRSIDFDIDGGGLAPTVGIIGSKIMGYSGTITGWKIIEQNGTSSSIVLTVKKNGTVISGTEKPTLSNQSTNTDTSLSSWTTSFSKGDVVSINIDSASIGTKFGLSIYAEALS